MRMKTPNKSRMGRSGEAFKWSKTMATKKESDDHPSADAVSRSILRPSVVSTSTRAHADVKGPIIQFSCTLRIYLI